VGLRPLCLLALWVRIPLDAWTFFNRKCCVLSGRCLCVKLITRLEESYREWRVQWVWSRSPVKLSMHSQLNWAILLCDVIPNGKNWVNCAVLTGNSAGFRTVLSSRLSQRKLSSSLRESHSFLSLPAGTTMASSQGTSVSINSFSRWASHDISLFKCHFLLHILRYLFFFSDNIMVDVASKQQTTDLLLSITVTRTRRHKELTKKLTNLMGNRCCAREHSVQFFVQFFTQLNCTV
jgi:hypothetical protein